MKEAQNTGKATATPKQNAKPGFFRRIGRGIKETFAELKKVSWPTFGETMKQLGAVVAVVLFFLVVLIGIDALLGLAFEEFKQGLSGGALINSLTWLLK